MGFDQYHYGCRSWVWHIGKDINIVLHDPCGMNGLGHGIKMLHSQILLSTA